MRRNFSNYRIFIKLDYENNNNQKINKEPKDKKNNKSDF